MNILTQSFLPRRFACLVMMAAATLAQRLPAQTQSPEQVLAAMEKCREQVISQLSFSDKMKMKSAMGAIAKNPEMVAATAAVANAPTPQAQVVARRALAKLKLDLIEKQDPSLQPIVEKIRTAQASVIQ